MFAVLSNSSVTKTTYLAMVGGDQADVMQSWLSGRSRHNSVILEDVPTINIINDGTEAITGFTWTRSNVRLDQYQSTWQWSKSPSKMPPVSRPGFRSAALVATTSPTFDCVNFSDRMVPILRAHADQPSQPVTYFLPCEVYRFANYTTRSTSSTYNLTVTNNYHADDDDDDTPPPRPPKTEHNDQHGPSSSGAPPVQV